MATAGDTSIKTADTSLWKHDYERVTILDNGNIGINMPPDTTGLVDSVFEQMQLGGGSVAPAGYFSPIPGLTFYGGNRYEGMAINGGGTASVDYRFIAFNERHNPWTGTHSRIAPMGMSDIAFADVSGGMVQLTATPYLTDTLTNLSGGMTLNLTGSGGLSLWSDETPNGGINYHHLFDVLRPGDTTWPLLRNPNGAFIHHTPVLITSDSTSDPSINFMGFTNVRPDIGDDSTWMLAVNGPMLAKEIFVLDSAWADYVFDPGYELPSLGEVENYIKANHHLPDIEPASKIAKTGVPVGRTEEALTKKVEELTLYVIDQNKEINDQNKKIEQLEADIQELKNQKEK